MTYGIDMGNKFYKPKAHTAADRGRKIEEIAAKEGVHRGSVHSGKKKQKERSMANILYPSCNVDAKE